MKDWIRNFQKTSRETKWYLFNWVAYGLLIILTTIYCYARLDYVRSNHKANSQKSNNP